MTNVIEIRSARRNRSAAKLKPMVKVDVMDDVRIEAHKMVQRLRAKRLGISVVKPHNVLTKPHCAGCFRAVSAKEWLSVKYTASTTTLHCRGCWLLRQEDGAQQGNRILLEVGRANEWTSCHNCAARISPHEHCARDHVEQTVKCSWCFEHGK